MSSGLRCREQYDYRIYPARLFFIAKPNAKLSDIKEYVENVQSDPDNCSILKIRLGNSNINFYRDVSMDDNVSVFTYTNIPAKFITKVF